MKQRFSPNLFAEERDGLDMQRFWGLNFIFSEFRKKQERTSTRIFLRYCDPKWQSELVLSVVGKLLWSWWCFLPSHMEHIGILTSYRFFGDSFFGWVVWGMTTGINFAFNYRKQSDDEMFRNFQLKSETRYVYFLFVMFPVGLPFDCWNGTFNIFDQDSIASAAIGSAWVRFIGA